MTKVKDILSINLDEDIKSVVDLDTTHESEEECIKELDDFILTETLSKHLMDFCDYYVSNTKQPGIWLSGFYGSGKSFFAKILGYLLENPTWKGTSVRDRFAPKLDGLSNASLLQNDIDEVCKLHNHVVRFDVSKHSNKHGISFMILENLLLSVGCLGSSIGLWELDMMNDGSYVEFTRRVQEIEGRPWNEVKHILMLSRKVFRKVMLDWKYDQYDYDQTMKDYDNRVETYDATKLKGDLKKYLDKHPNERLIFFLDEVSEAINQDRIRIDELEGMAEALWDFGDKVWTVCIAQQQLDDVINSKNVKKDSLTKLTDRFRKGININAEEIDTIIRQRLLAKTDAGEQELQDYYNKKSGAVNEITNIGGGLKVTRDAKTFADYYPFFTHQFRLLQFFLFGSGKLVNTQGGTRGMLISSFDVIKKEAMKDAELYTTVNAVQLCRRAEENVDSALENRYRQAEGIIKDSGLQHVNGRNLLMAIHFLSKADVIKTTPENITKSCVRNMDEYYDLLSEVRKALDILVESRVLIFSAGQYRITSEAEQHILDKKRKLEESIPTYQVKALISKKLQTLSFIRTMQSRQIGDTKVNFFVGIRDGENFVNSNDDAKKILLSHLFNMGDSEQEYVESIKDTTQSEKGEINLIPSIAYNDQIFALARDLMSMDFLVGDQTYTPDEKAAVQTILSTKEDKDKNLTNLIRQAYTEGYVVYCYDTYKVSEEKLPDIIGDLQGRMYNNIYTRRLVSQISSDKLAPRVFHTTDTQLCRIFGPSDEFAFFDNSGKFIGDNLGVVTEVTSLSKQYITGADLEKKLENPPTGYSFATVITTVAALFRGDKMTVKFGGQEYHSWKEPGAEDAFATSRNFERASFKAVLKTLTYQQRQDIVDTLKDCEYDQLTGYKISYEMNDFDLVRAICGLAHSERQKVLRDIFGDNEREQLFRSSMAAADVLKVYEGTITDANYLQTAGYFLQNANNDEYVKAIEKIERDANFIRNSFEVINDERKYIHEVEEELNLAAFDKSAFMPLTDLWEQMYKTNIVSNFSKMKQTTLKVADFYHDVMQQEADKLTDKYLEVGKDLEAFVKKLEPYDHKWNEALWRQAEDLEKKCEKLTSIRLDIPQGKVNDKGTGFALHDFVNEIALADQWKTKIDLWESDIRTTAPTPPESKPKPGDGTGPTPPSEPQPKVVSMRSKMPSGKKNKKEYRQWLKEQLEFVNQLKDNDIIDFDK